MSEQDSSDPILEACCEFCPRSFMGNGFAVLSKQMEEHLRTYHQAELQQKFEQLISVMAARTVQSLLVSNPRNISQRKDKS